MSSRSRHGGRHELGQNFLVHPPTLDRIVSLVAATDGPILEIGAGDGAVTARLARLDRDLRAVEIDEHRVASLRRRLHTVDVVHGDALQTRIDRPVVVGNIPFGLTTPILRHLLASDTWQHAIVLTQWEVARKRAGVGGSTLMTAQAAPWWTFDLTGRVPAHGFSPVPTVDGGVLHITRRETALVPHTRRRSYERFVRRVFTGRGHGIADIIGRAGGLTRADARYMVSAAGIDAAALPRDLTPRQWAEVFVAVSRRRT